MSEAPITVIMPVYNRRTTALEALESVSAQTAPPDQVVVVDDGSTDGSGEAIARWLARGALRCPTSLIRQSNQGVSAARNRGLRALTKHPLVAFLDSDDLWPEDFLQRTRIAMERQPQAIAASVDRRRVNTQTGTQALDCLAGLGRHPARWIFEHDAGIASATVFRTHAVQQLEGFREDLHTAEDAELFLRLTGLGPWLHVAGAAVTFRHGEAENRGEAGNLSFRFADKHRRGAQVFDNFATSAGGRHDIDRQWVAPILANMWYRAGRELAAVGNTDDARECFRNSTTWQRWNHKSWLRLWQTYLPRAA